jgi:hypothetical protein
MSLTLSTPVGLVTITELDGLVLAFDFLLAVHSLLISEDKEAHTSRGTGGDNGAVQTGLGDNIHLDGGVAARVVDGTSVDLGDRHVGERWW